MTSDHWPLVRLGDFVQVIHGFAFKTRYANDEPSPYALFTRKNVGLRGGFREDGPRYYHGDFDERFLLDPGDLMLALTDLSKDGDLLGLPAIVPSAADVRYLHNQRVGKVLVVKDGVDEGFLYGLFRSPEYRRHVLNTASQTTVRDTAPSRLHEYRFKLPSLTEQKRIASTLRALDDKINSNARLARLLEETLHTLFRARFVDLVGSHDKVAHESGGLPRGWRSGTLAEIGTLHREFVKGASELPYIGLDLMPRGSTVLTEWLIRDAPTGQSALFEAGDILFGKLRPYFRKVGVPPITGRCSTEILVLRPSRPEYYGVLLGHVASQRFIDHCQAVSRGTRMPRAEWKDASVFDIALPPADIASEFTETATVLYRQIAKLTFDSQTLSELRNMLLPKLISGEIRVPEAAPRAVAAEPAASERAA